MSINESPSLKAQAQGKKGSFQMDISTEIPLQGVTGIIGRSGSGKTTFLRWLAGLETDFPGELSLGLEVWQNKNSFTPAHERDVSLVFQGAALFPHMTVHENLVFAMRRAPDNRAGISLENTIELLSIKGLLGRKPETLSGGERQKVAIARSLLAKPKLLLLDEPLSALDNESKEEILEHLVRLKTQLPLTMIYVTHSLGELSPLADRVLHMQDGQIKPHALQEEQLHQKVFSFIAFSGTGKTTLLESLIPRLKARNLKVGALKHDAHRFEIDYPGKDSYRFTKAGADRMVIASKEKVAMVHQLNPEYNLPPQAEQLITQHFGNLDIVLTEGYKNSSLPKFIIDRSGHPDEKRLIRDKSLKNVIGVICDKNLHPWYRENCELPLFDLDEPEALTEFIYHFPHEVCHSSCSSN